MHLAFLWGQGSPCSMHSCIESQVLRRCEPSAGSLSSFWNRTARCGVTVEHMLQRGLLACKANFRLASTDTGNVSTSVEQSLVHLSSSSSSLADLNPRLACSHPASFRLPFSYFPFRSITGGITQLKKHQCVCHCVSQGHESHIWVFTVGRIKVLVLRLTLKDVAFTLGWWLWLSRLRLNESMLATHRHYTTLHSFT